MTDHYGRHEIEAQERLDAALGTRLVRTPAPRRSHLADLILAKTASKTVFQSVREGEERHRRRMAKGDGPMKKLHWYKKGLGASWRAYTRTRRGDDPSNDTCWEIDHRGKRQGYVLKMNGREVSRNNASNVLMARACKAANALGHRHGRDGVL
jgi:hypothetical protein